MRSSRHSTLRNNIKDDKDCCVFTGSTTIDSCTMNTKAMSNIIIPLSALHDDVTRPLSIGLKGWIKSIFREESGICIIMNSKHLVIRKL